MSDSLIFRPIGMVKSCFRDKFGTPRQPGLVAAADAIIEINPEFQPQFSLQGLEQFSHLWVIFHFHLVDSKKFRGKVHPPRLDGETVGVFATRSPHRPNPIGLSLVEIVKVEGPAIYIRGHDLVDGTPVLDIKPYIKEIESQPAATSGWVEKVSSLDVRVSWAQKAETQLFEFMRGQNDLRQLIEETLKLDPRPRVYRGLEGAEPKYRETHSVRLRHVDVEFIFRAANEVEVLDLKLIDE